MLPPLPAALHAGCRAAAAATLRKVPPPQTPGRPRTWDAVARERLAPEQQLRPRYAQQPLRVAQHCLGGPRQHGADGEVTQLAAARARLHLVKQARLDPVAGLGGGRVGGIRRSGVSWVQAQASTAFPPSCAARPHFHSWAGGWLALRAHRPQRAPPHLCANSMDCALHFWPLQAYASWSHCHAT